MLARMPKDLIKKPAKWFALETIGNFLYEQIGAVWRSAIMIAVVTASIRIYTATPLDIRLIIGLFVFALVFFTLDRVVARRHNKQSGMVTGTPNSRETVAQLISYWMLLLSKATKKCL
jgi:hypothetical protein